MQSDINKMIQIGRTFREFFFILKEEKKSENAWRYDNVTEIYKRPWNSTAELSRFIDS